MDASCKAAGVETVFELLWQATSANATEAMVPRREKVCMFMVIVEEEERGPNGHSKKPSFRRRLESSDDMEITATAFNGKRAL